jgi:hypothetical protein
MAICSACTRAGRRLRLTDGMELDFIFPPAAVNF